MLLIVLPAKFHLAKSDGIEKGNVLLMSANCLLKEKNKMNKTKQNEPQQVSFPKGFRRGFP